MSPRRVHAARILLASSELATRSVGRVASARAGVRSTAEYESYECVSKLEPIVRSCTRKYNTGTADDRRARVARAQYSMRHACSTMILGHANVRKSCTNNSGHQFVPIPVLSIRRRQRAPCTLLRAAWLQLTLRPARRRACCHRSALTFWWSWRVADVESAS